MTRADLVRLLLVGVLTVLAFHGSRSGRLVAIDHPVDEVVLALQPGYRNHHAVTVLVVEADAGTIWDRLLDTLETLADNPPRDTVLMPVPVPPDARAQARLAALREKWSEFWQPLGLARTGHDARATLLAPWGLRADDRVALDTALRHGVVSVERDDDGVVRRQQLRFGRASDSDAPSVLRHVAVELTASNEAALVPDRVLLRPVRGLVGELPADRARELGGGVGRVVIESRVPRFDPLRYRLIGESRPVSAAHVQAVAIANVVAGNWREPVPAAVHLGTLAVIGGLLVWLMRRRSLRAALGWSLLALALWVPLAWAGQMAFGWRVLPSPMIVLAVGLLVAEVHRRYSQVGQLTTSLEQPLLAARTTATAEPVLTSATGASAASNVPQVMRTEAPEAVAFASLAGVLRDLVPVLHRIDIVEYLAVTRRHPDRAGWFAPCWLDGSEAARDIPALPEELELDEVAVTRLINGESVLTKNLAGDQTATILVPARAIVGDGTVLVGAIAITLRGDAEALIRELGPFLPSVAAETARAIREAVAARALRELERPGRGAMTRLDQLAPVADADLDLTRELRAALDALPVGIAILDLSTRIRYANRAFALLPARRSIPLELQPPLAETLARHSADRSRTARDERVELAEVAASGIRARYPLEIDGRHMLLTVRALHPGSRTGRSEPMAIYDTPQPAAPRVPGLLAVLQDAAAESRWARTRAVLAERLADARGAVESGPARDLLGDLAKLFGLATAPTAMPSAPDHAPFDLAEVCVEAAAGAGTEVTASGDPVPRSAAGDRAAVRDALDGLFAALDLKGSVRVEPGTDDRGDPAVTLQIRPGSTGSATALRTELSVLVDEHRTTIERLGGRLHVLDGTAPGNGTAGPDDAVCCRITFPAF